MKDPSKVTKVLIDKIHGGRKQDSKFWQSEFSEKNNKQVSKRDKNKRNLVEFLSLFFLSVIGIGIVIYGGYFMYNRYRIEFSQPEPIIQDSNQSQRPPQIQKRTIPEDRPITKRELDRAIKKALAAKSSNQQENTIPKPDRFYYRVELVNGGKIEAQSASRDGDLFTIKDKKGLVFSVNRNEIKSVKKVKL